MVLRSTGIYVLGVQRLIRQRNRAAAMERCAPRLARRRSIARCVFWGPSPLKAVAFITHSASCLLPVSRMQLCPQPQRDASGRSQSSGWSFARRQVITSRNVAGGWFTNVALGGLNFQIEHHLFPNMPRPLSRAQSIVRAFCLDNDLSYREDSLTGSYRQTIQGLEQPRSRPRKRVMFCAGRPMAR